jgi:hypothetical protein
MTAPAIKHHQRASPLEIFRERAEARCLLVGHGLMTLQTAVDELQESAVRQGLVKRTAKTRFKKFWGRVLQDGCDHG